MVSPFESSTGIRLKLVSSIFAGFANVFVAFNTWVMLLFVMAFFKFYEIFQKSLTYHFQKKSNKGQFGDKSGLKNGIIWV